MSARRNLFQLSTVYTITKGAKKFNKKCHLSDNNKNGLKLNLIKTDCNVFFQFCLYSLFNNGHHHKVALQKSGYGFRSRSLMRKPEGRKNTLRQHEEVTLRGTRHHREPVLLCVTPDSTIISHYSSTAEYYKDKVIVLKGSSVFLISLECLALSLQYPCEDFHSIMNKTIMSIIFIIL